MTYQQLKNEIRRDTAIELLTRTDQSLQDISDQLNFQEVSAFHRAFKNGQGLVQVPIDKILLDNLYLIRLKTIKI